MTARISLILGKARGHSSQLRAIALRGPRLQFTLLAIRSLQPAQRLLHAWGLSSRNIFAT
jgi:hypothetical protein